MQQPEAPPGITVRRSADRFVTVAPERPDAAAGWATTRHSFSFGEHYDPDRVGFGPLLALNDETLRAGEHYPEHTHRDVEIVTWVISGELHHEDSTGGGGTNRITLVPGDVQLVSAGSGVRHVEGAGPDGPVRFVQTWLRPDEPGTEPAWQAGGVEDVPLLDGWCVLATDDPEDPSPLVHPHSRGTALRVLGMQPGRENGLPDVASMYLFVARGSVEVEQVGVLEEGDALEVTRPAPLGLRALTDAELLLWAFAS